MPRIPAGAGSRLALCLLSLCVVTTCAAEASTLGAENPRPSTTSATASSTTPGPEASPAAVTADVDVELRASSLDVSATQLVTLTASVAVPAGDAAPAGEVTFTDGDRLLGHRPVVAGVATYRNNDLPVGPHDIVASYPASAGAAPATAQVRLTIRPPTVDPFRGTGTSVAVIGDSITLAAEDDIVASLGAVGGDPSVTGLYGYTTASAKPYVDAYVPVSPSIVIVELGTNDIIEMVNSVPGKTPEGLQARMQALTSSFPSACVAVTTVVSQRTRGVADPQRWEHLASTYNRWLRANYATVIDWDQAATDAPADRELLNDDGVHPNHLGVRALADLFQSAANRCAHRSHP